ncbi:hypothetical protein AaE_008335, partial [Aphanomyces astaci]
SFDPTFNELLVVNIPPHASADGAGGGWGVRLDLIQRPSANNQGDDILLAFAALPLDGFRPGAELSMTLAFPRQSQTTTTEQAEIFVTMFRQRRYILQDAAMSTLWHRLELTIDAMPATHGSLKHEQTIAVVQIVPSATTSVPLLVESPLPFPTIRCHADFAKANERTNNCRVTPGGHGDSTMFGWRYPALFDFSIVPNAFFIQVALYAPKATSTYVCVGSSAVTTLAVPSRQGSSVPWPSILMRMSDAPWEMPLHGMLRWWEGASWQDFRKQRVVCTNRLQATNQSRTVPQWMAAIARGLNRHPISTVVDTGGIVGMIAAMYQCRDIAPDSNDQTQLPSKKQDDPAVGNWQAQLQGLVAEIAAKQAFMDKMQIEMDKRTNAIKSCGVEIVDLRKNVQRKDQLIQALQLKLHNYEVLEQRQQEEIRLCLDGHGVSTTSFPVLAQHYTKLQSKHNTLEASHAQLSKKLLEARNFEAELLETKIQYKALEAAHLSQANFIQSQANFIQKANAEMQKLAVYKQTIATQETVIGKLENLVESKLAEAKASSVGPNVHAEIFRLRLENSYLKEQLTFVTLQLRSASSMQEQPHALSKANLEPLAAGKTTFSTSSRALQPLTSTTPPRRLKSPNVITSPPSTRRLRPQPNQCDTLTSVAPPQPETTDASTNTEPSSSDAAARMSVPSTDHDDNDKTEDVLRVKIRVLEDQLRLNTTSAAQEIAALKAHVFELELESQLH